VIGNHLNRLLNINANHALYSKTGDWYHIFKSFPGVLFDHRGYIIFQSEKEYYSHPRLRITERLNIKGGIVQLSGYKKYTDDEKSLFDGVISFDKKEINNRSVRVQRLISVISRDKRLVDDIKSRYENTCQICDLSLSIDSNLHYSEVHHIIPLGYPFNGEDKLNNMMCVCPNCHILLDYKSFKLDISSLKQLKHKISQKAINFHNKLVNKRYSYPICTSQDIAN